MTLYTKKYFTALDRAIMGEPNTAHRSICVKKCPKMNEHVEGTRTTNVDPTSL